MEEKKIKHIYWFAYFNLNSPSVRYRGKFPLDYLNLHYGINSDLIIPGYSVSRLSKFIKVYFLSIFSNRTNTLIVVQRVQSNFIYATLLKLLLLIKRHNTVYDIDDADYLEQKSKSILYFAKKSTFISAGSTEIAQHLFQFNKRVLHITSPTVDLNIEKANKNKMFTIGWIGGFGWGHRESMYEYVFEAIKSLQFQCKFILIGITDNKDEIEIKKYFENYHHIELEMPRNIDWLNEFDIQNRICEFDVGVATLLNHPYQLAKSGIKAKQYLNNGVPVLSTNLPENNKIVQCGINGFLCNSAQEFALRMKQFHEMGCEEYKQFSQNARNSISNFNHNKYYNNIQTLINMKTNTN